MNFNPNVFDLWVFREKNVGIEYLLLHTSQQKADNFFNGGRFWQIPSGAFLDDESVTDRIDRELQFYGLKSEAIWAAEHAYTIYNRRFNEMQLISVYAAKVDGEVMQLNPAEHAEWVWLGFAEALQRVHYRGLKDGLRSAHEYIGGVAHPARELRLR